MNHEEPIRKFLIWLSRNDKYTDSEWYNVFSLVDEYYNSLGERMIHPDDVVEDPEWYYAWIDWYNSLEKE